MDIQAAMIRHIKELSRVSIRMPFYRLSFKTFSHGRRVGNPKYPVGYKHPHTKENARRVAQMNGMRYQIIDREPVFFYK